MTRARAILLSRKSVAVICVLWSLSDVRAETPGSSEEQVTNLATVESWKDYLADRGITLDPEWDADVFVNAYGGIKQAAVTDGLIRLGLDLDCQKITKLSYFENTDIHVEGYYTYGSDISAYVGDLAGVNNNYAYNSPRLNEMWAQKGIPMGPFDCSIRTGLLAADQEFDVNDVASFFINSSFGAPLGLAGNAPIPVYPFAALALRLDVSVGDPSTFKVTFRDSGEWPGSVVLRTRTCCYRRFLCIKSI